MKVVLRGKYIKGAAGWAQVALFVAATGIFGYCASVLVDTWVFQRETGREFD